MPITPPVDNSIQISFVEPLVPLEDFQNEQLTTEPVEPVTSVDTSSDVPDYAAFMLPRGLTRDHIRGESF